MYPSREEFTELIYYISELKHAFTHKIDEQSVKINEQSLVIEELLWQIRELSDKIRQLTQWKSDTERVINESRRKFDDLCRTTCVCRYENHIPKNRNVNSRQSSNAYPQRIQKNQQQMHDMEKNKNGKHINARGGSLNFFEGCLTIILHLPFAMKCQNKLEN